MICPRCRASYEANERYCIKDAASLVERTDFDRINTTVGSYRLHNILGRGGMGTVYRGEHVYIGKPVAVKILHERFARNEDSVHRFLREARAASSINHPNIADVTDFGPTAEGSVYFVMEYIEGEGLEDIIAREGPLALHRAINIVIQMSSALGRAHEQGIVHRDLKPDNVILAKRQGRRELIRAVGPGDDGAMRFSIEPEQTYDFVKLLDFGIALVQDPRSDAHEAAMAASGTICGTPEYMSPEAARGGAIDGRADIYSLGVIFYDMLTASVPFQAESPMETLQLHLHQAAQPPRQRRPDAEITEAAEQLILRAIEKRPEDRHQTMDELREDLKRCYGSIAYRRDSLNYAGARGAGVGPRRSHLTEELSAAFSDPGASATGIPLLTPIDDAIEWARAPRPMAAEESGPLLLTQRKPQG